MIRNLLMAIGLMKAPKSWIARRAGLVAPVGGTVPMIAWFAWKNRAHIKSAYGRYVAPRLGGRAHTATAAV